MPINPDENHHYTAKKAGRKGLMLAIMRATNEDERWACIQALDKQAFKDGNLGTMVFEISEFQQKPDSFDE